MKKKILICLITLAALTLIFVGYVGSIALQDHDRDFTFFEIISSLAMFAVAIITIECDVFCSIGYLLLDEKRGRPKFILNIISPIVSVILLIATLVMILTGNFKLGMFMTVFLMLWTVFCVILHATELILSFERRIRDD